MCEYKSIFSQLDKSYRTTVRFRDDYRVVVMGKRYTSCRTCAAARRSSTLKEKLKYLFLANVWRDKEFLSLQVKYGLGVAT